MELCDPCQEQWNKWLEYNGKPRPINIVQIGNMNGRVPYGQRVIETIKSQLALIETICAEQGHTSVKEGK